MLPENIMPVINIIRSEIPKPNVYPYFNIFGWLSWIVNRNGDMCTPMGLHKKSTNLTPYYGHSFANGKCSTEQVRAFADWWAKQKNQKIIDEIWFGCTKKMIMPNVHEKLFV